MNTPNIEYLNHTVLEGTLIARIGNYTMASVDRIAVLRNSDDEVIINVPGVESYLDPIEARELAARLLMAADIAEQQLNAGA